LEHQQEVGKKAILDGAGCVPSVQVLVLKILKRYMFFFQSNIFRKVDLGS
jgi:hypothetical protein